MRKPITLLCLLHVASLELSAGSNNTYDFLRIDVGPRAAALGGSFVSITNDPNVLFYNTAALATIEESKGSIGFFKHLLDINTGHLSFSKAQPDIGFFGVGIVFTNYGTINRTDDLGNVLGTFSASELAFSIGYANVLEHNLYYGGGLKFIYSSIESYSSTGLAGDLGILYLIPESRLSLGASIRNIGGQLSTYAGTSEQLPLDFTVGASIVPRGLPLLLNLNFHKLNEAVSDFGDRFKAFTVGGEFTISRVIQLRIGYDNEKRRELKLEEGSGLAGFSGGLGLTIGDYLVDYALNSLGNIGAVHRIAVATSF